VARPIPVPEPVTIATRLTVSISFLRELPAFDNIGLNGAGQPIAGRCTIVQQD
jgi:hypothetical protein